MYPPGIISGTALIPPDARPTFHDRLSLHAFFSQGMELIVMRPAEPGRDGILAKQTRVLSIDNEICRVYGEARNRESRASAMTLG